MDAHFHLPFNAWLYVEFDSYLRDEKQKQNNQKLNTGNQQTTKTQTHSFQLACKWGKICM